MRARNVLFGVLALIILFNCVYAFEINGTIYDANKLPVNNTNISVLVRDGTTWSQISINTTNSNASGFFNLTLATNESYMFQITIFHVNASTGQIDLVGQSLPSFPYAEVAGLTDTKYYLKQAGTINISVVNKTGNAVSNNQYAYQVKDTSLGYPVQSCFSDRTFESVCYVPTDRNYSIMVYHSSGSPQQFVPVGFDWSNFTTSTSYTFGLSNYNATTKTLSKRFNVSESFARIKGYINGSSLGAHSWNTLNVIPLLLEPGNMVFMNYGTLPFNASAWNSGSSDYYNITNGFYNITVIL